MRVSLSVMCLLIVAGLLRAEEGIAPEDPQLGRQVDFYQDVYPILESKCLACHSTAVAEGDLILESAKSIIKGGASGEAVVPGKPDDSYLYQVIARTEEPAMPPLPNKVQAKALTPKELGLFRKWIEEGAQAGTRVIDNSIAWQSIPETYKAVYSLAFGPERRFIYAGRGNRIFVYDLLSGNEVARLTDPSLLSLEADGQPVYGPGVAHRDFVHSLALSSDGKLLASGGYRVVKLWERTAPRELGSLNIGADVKSTTISSDGSLAAFLRADNQLQIWDLSTGQAGPVLNSDGTIITAVAFSPDSKSLVSATDAGVLRISQIADGATTVGLTIPGNVTALEMLNEGPLLITSGQDHVIRLWNWVDVQQPVAEGGTPPQPVRELKGHSQPITSLIVAQDRKELLSGSNDQTVRVWNLNDGSQLFSQGLDGVVTDVAMTADGNVMAATGENKITRIWSRDGKKLADVQGNQQLASAHATAIDDQTVANAELAIADAGLKEAEQDLAQREESLKKAQEQKDKVAKELEEAAKKAADAKAKVDEAEKALAGNPEDAGLKKAKEDADKAFATEEDARKKKMDEVASADRAIQLSQQSIEVAKQNVEARKTTKTAKEEAKKTRDEAVTAAKSALDAAVVSATSVAISGDQQTVIISGASQPTQTFALQSGQPTGVIEIPATVQDAHVTTSGSLLTIEVGGQVRLWDITPRWNLIAQLGVSKENPLDVSNSKFEDRVTALAFNRQGRHLATGGGTPSRNGELMLWSIPTGELVRTMTDAHSDAITDIEFSRDGALLVSGATDKFVKVFRVEDGSLVRAYEGHTDHVLGVAIKADNSSLASAGADMAIKIWNTETGEQRRTISNYGKQVTSIDYIGISDNLISGSGDQTVKMHTAENGRNYRGFGGATDFIYATLATGDESHVIAGGEDGVIRVWKGTDGNLLKSFAPPASNSETAQR